MNRLIQIALWVASAPVLGLVQGATSILISGGIQELRQWDAWRTFALISIFYGSCWFVPAVLLADLVFLRRVLRSIELKRYLRVIVICALLIGVVTPGYALVIGYPLTALAILVTGYSYRKRPGELARA
jgi:hypothetical protein